MWMQTRLYITWGRKNLWRYFQFQFKVQFKETLLNPMQDGFWYISLQQVKSFFNRELGNHFTFLAVVSNLSNAVSIKYEKFPRHLKLLLKKFHCLKSLGSMSTIVALFKTFFSICLKLVSEIGKVFYTTTGTATFLTEIRVYNSVNKVLKQTE